MMDTPNFKCPRSGRVLTPLSMDYWRLKKKLNRLLSDSSSSDEKTDETPFKKPSQSRKKPPGPKSEKAVRSRLYNPATTADLKPLPAGEEEELTSTGSESRRRESGAPESVFKLVEDEDSDDENVVFKPRSRRRAQKFTIRISDSGSEEPQNASRDGSNQDETEGISKALFSTKICSAGSPPAETKARAGTCIEISSDDEDRPGLDARVRGAHKSPPLKQSNLQNPANQPVTEPKKRTVPGIGRGVMPPPTAPVKRIVKATAQPRKEGDSDGEFDELLEKLRNREHDDDEYDESQVDLNDTVSEWEKSNADHRNFLESLDEESVPLKSCHEDALVYRKNKFNAIKDELVKKLFDLFHKTVFQNRFESEIPITWNVRMAKTGGFCYYRRHVSGSRSARIELSPKVVDRASRLRDTLLHEMCHAGAWLIHGYRNGHGVLFKFWGQRAFQLLGLVVTTCHTYVIETKYIYKCQGCANEVRRHSKSLDTSRFICSNCKGRFELFLNNKRNNQLTPVTERKPSPFSEFVKEEYKVIKTKSPHLKHGEVMSVLSERWKTIKNRV